MVKKLKAEKEPVRLLYNNFLDYYGLNKSQSRRLFRWMGFNLLGYQLLFSMKIVNYMEIFLRQNYLIEGFLKEERFKIIQELLIIKSLKGLRMSNGIPSNGQRSKQNGKTAKKFKLKYYTKVNTMRSEVFKLTNFSVFGY